jgi:membrane-bound metal-dependent hydrolase YbcI (DUF457 family)
MVRGQPAGYNPSKRPRNMDIVHHGLIGGVGFVALASQNQELAALGFLAGSVFPDLDVAFMALGKRAYLRLHQGPTHSLLLAPLYASLLALLPALQFGFDWLTFLAILAGLWLHLLLDLLNTFGIQILWPLTPRRYCKDAVFFIDTVTWLLTLSFFGLVYLAKVDPLPAALGYAVAFAGYLIAKHLLHRRVLRQNTFDYAIPSAFNPFSFLTLSRNGDCFELSLYNALTRRSSRRDRIPAPSPEVLVLAAQSRVFRDMQHILRSLQITGVEQEAAGTTLTAQDLAIRNFGGKFGRTVLKFDPQGKLIHEMAHI